MIAANIDVYSKYIKKLLNPEKHNFFFMVEMNLLIITITIKIITCKHVKILSLLVHFIEEV